MIKNDEPLRCIQNNVRLRPSLAAFLLIIIIGIFGSQSCDSSYASDRKDVPTGVIDLAILNLSVIPDPAYHSPYFRPGTFPKIITTVKNLGSEDRSAWMNYSDNGKVFAGHTINPSLKPNESRIANISWLATPGNHTLRVWFGYDYTDDNNSNNEASIIVHVPDYPPSSKVYEINGFIFNGSTGKKIAGWVDFDYGGWIRTRSDGGYTWNLTNGTHTVTVAAEGYQDLTTAINVSSPDRIWFNFTLWPKIISTPPPTVDLTITLSLSSVIISIVTLAIVIQMWRKNQRKRDNKGHNGSAQT